RDRARVPGGVQVVSDPGGRPPANGPALRRAEPAAGRAGAEGGGLAVVELVAAPPRRRDLAERVAGGSAGPDHVGEVCQRGGDGRGAGGPAPVGGPGGAVRGRRGGGAGGGAAAAGVEPASARPAAEGAPPG